jgi:1,2-diacylglycerol 3-alpha-glucosyltransferase
VKIAIFTDTYAPQINGVVTSIQTFATELERLGHQVVVACPKIEGVESTDAVWRFKSMPFPFQTEYRMTSPLSRKLTEFKSHEFDVVHVQTPFFMGHLGQFLAWKNKIPVVYTYHTFWEEYLHYFPVLPSKIRKKLYISLLSKKFCARCDHIVAPSTQIKEALEAYGIQIPIRIVPTGIPMRQHPTESEKAIFRQTWALDANRQYLTFVGRLGLEKNIGFLLHAFAELAPTCPTAGLLIIGDGPERENFQLLARQLGIADRCIWTGYLTHSDIFTAYACSTLVAFPSKTETQGLSLLEGLSLGLPAVCLNAMGIRDILAGEKGGFLCEDSVTDFAEKCRLLLTDSTIYEQKSVEARLCVNRFSVDATTAQILDVYQTVQRR